MKSTHLKKSDHSNHSSHSGQRHHFKQMKQLVVMRYILSASGLLFLLGGAWLFHSRASSPSQEEISLWLNPVILSLMGLALVSIGVLPVIYFRARKKAHISTHSSQKQKHSASERMAA